MRLHATLDNGFKELAQNVALAKTAMPVLGKRRVVWDLERPYRERFNTIRQDWTFTGSA